MRRASHCHQTPHAFRAQSGPVTRTIRPNTTTSSAAAAASGRRRPGPEKVHRAGQAADEGRQEHHHRRRDVVVEDLLAAPAPSSRSGPSCRGALSDQHGRDREHRDRQRARRAGRSVVHVVRLTPSSAARTSTATASRTRYQRTPAAPATSAPGRRRAPPRTARPCRGRPAMITGMVIGYSRMGSITSRLRARTSMAANSVPTAAKPIVPARSSPASVSGRLPIGAWNSRPIERHEHRLDDRQQQDDAEQLADVDGRPARRRQHERPQRLGVPLALEGAPEGQRARERHGDPHDPGRRVLQRPALLDEREREHQHARDREEDRRVEDLAAPHLDGQVLAHDEPGDAQEHHRWNPGPTGSGSVPVSGTDSDPDS